MPINYRIHKFNLSGRVIYIAAMARPDYKKQDKNTVFRFLSESGERPLLIGLHDEHNYEADARKYGLEYILFPMSDAFEVKKGRKNANLLVSPSTYDAIYTHIQRALHQIRPVILHCGAGHGRSGTTLAALKMRQLIEVSKGKILREGPNKSVRPSLEAVSIECSSIVASAVEHARNELFMEERFGHGNAHKCVEFESDLINLENYRQHLLKEYSTHSDAVIATAATRALCLSRLAPTANDDVRVRYNSVKMELVINEKLSPTIMHEIQASSQFDSYMAEVVAVSAELEEGNEELTAFLIAAALNAVISGLPKKTSGFSSRAVEGPVAQTQQTRHFYR